MRHRLDSTAQPQLSEPSSESNDSLNIIETERTLADRATVASAVTGAGGRITDAINFGADVLERMEHDNQSRSNGERVGCAVVGELARYTTLAVGEYASLRAAGRSGRSWGASNPAATAVCGTHELAVTFTGIATTIEIANSVGDSAERLCHTIVQAPSIPPSFPRPSPSNSNSSITLLDYAPTSLPIRTTFNTQRENSIPARELSLFGEGVAVPRVTGSYSQVLQSLHPGASSILSLNRASGNNTNRTHAVAKMNNNTAQRSLNTHYLQSDNLDRYSLTMSADLGSRLRDVSSRERLATPTSTSIIAQRFNESHAPSSQICRTNGQGGGCRSRGEIINRNNTAVRELGNLRERTTQRIPQRNHSDFRFTERPGFFVSADQSQVYCPGEYSIPMSERPRATSRGQGNNSESGNNRSGSHGGGGGGGHEGHVQAGGGCATTAGGCVTTGGGGGW